MIVQIIEYNTSCPTLPITVEAEGQTTEVKIDYDAILRAVSLNLRDEYLQKHPEIE